MSLACSESAARSRQAQQRRGRRCCGGSDDEAGLDGGWNSNSVPLSLYRTTCRIDSHLDC